MRNLESMGLRLTGNKLEILDQRLLPQEELWRDASDPNVLIECIQGLGVRGAPLIGVSAALSLMLFSRSAKAAEVPALASRLRKARPTAVNLMNAIDRCTKAFAEGGHEALEAEAFRIFDEDVALCEGMARQGSGLIADGDGVLTHCNTGGLATVGKGTALAVIRRAHEEGKKIHVYVDETRPLLQGARLTTWELGRLGIPYTLICDNMAATLMRMGKIQKIFVGADRIAANGDAANKIGTYSVAALAKFHGIPFYVVAPSTTLDPNCPDGAAIPIEERDAAEVHGKGRVGVRAWNPSFDVTPRALITKIVLDDKVI